MTSIVLADDHSVMRDGLTALLASQPDFQVLGEAADGLAVVPLVARLRPNVLVLDLMLPGLNGLEVARAVRHECPATRVLILSMHATESYVVDALRNGAQAYVTKDCPGKEVIAAIRAVTAGRTYLCAPFAGRENELLTRIATTDTEPYEKLSARERQIFQLAAEGYTSPQIAQRLFISPRTVETHRHNIMRKLDLRSHTELVRLAVSRGLLPESR